MGHGYKRENSNHGAKEEGFLAILSAQVSVLGSG